MNADPDKAYRLHHLWLEVPDLRTAFRLLTMGLLRELAQRPFTN